MRRRMLIATVLLMSIAMWSLAAGAFALSWRLTHALADAVALAEIGPRPQSTVVFDRHGHQVFSFFVEQRADVPLDRVSPNMIAAILAVEDRRFYQHHGLDPVRIAKAAWRDWRAHRFAEGGSTITQQLARLEQLSPTRTITRKVREAAIALRLEERYTKREILQAYLNAAYFGDGYYGVEAAARGYFGKSASEVQPHEAALLAGLVRSPSGYSPTLAPGRARQRRNLVLRLMRENGALSQDEYRRAIEMPLRPASVQRPEQSASGCGGYYQEEVRRQLVARFGGKQVLNGGLRVYTGYDMEMQCAAERTVRNRIAQIAKTHASARDLEGSLVALDPVSGEVRALVGGRDFGASPLIRATQSRRQPGSAFKPIIYAAALERGMAPATVLHHLDTPIMTSRGPWLPAGEHERSEYSLRSALKISSNRAAAQLLQQVGLSTTTYYAQRLGIESRLPEVPSLALGTGGVTLLELTSAYAVFANQGVAVSPHLIIRVEDAEGRLVLDNPPPQHQAITSATAFLMNSMLADVIGSGTATGVRTAGFKLPAAGKTGTADNYKDAWFIGYTPRLVTGVWFGMDRPAPIMNRGFAAVVAVPAWAEFMKHATAGDPPVWFSPPPDVEKVAICRLSGLRATDACRRGDLGAGYVQAGLTELPGEPTDGQPRAVGTTGTSGTVAGRSSVYEDYFPIGTAPTEYCPIHGSTGLDTIDSGAPYSSGLVPASAGEASSATATRIQRVVGPDGRVTWVIKQ